MNTAAPTWLPRTVAALTAGFLVLLATLHWLEPEYDPARRMISEYAVGRYGVLMQLAFVALGGAVLGLGALLRPFLPRPSIGLALTGLALFGAAAFKTDSLTQPPSHSASHGIHQACGAIVILGFPVIATVLARRLGRHARWASARGWLWTLTASLWAGQIAFFTAVRVLGRPPVGAVGWPNRMMMVAYCAWIAAVALRAGRASRFPAQQPRLPGYPAA